ncbi:NACHT domain-containing protein [Agrobacterium sp. Azo12]|jgi:hypothetical protein|uniref:NACHT domain-containing protein n=1 Tax=Agrobacterium sp. Azo12 TaxID=3031129 RepID=UPI0023D83563|nr:NACHT domain-containing protein [Agrobacterium sp. Azo12]MDO5895724.1 NACHT domain-containing protein [Agrobacterium sp. Azo12]
MNIAVVLTIVFAAIAVALAAYIIWMKWNARHSKPRFAFYTVLTLSALAMTTLGALMAVDWFGVAIDVLSVLGFPQNNANVLASSYWAKLIEKFVVAAFGATAIMFIARFAQRALSSWEGPLTMNAVRLQEEGKANHIVALAVAEISSKLSKQNDPIVDRRLVDWKQQIAPAPNAVDFNELARMAFLNHLPEASIDEGAWRQQSNTWVGTMFGPEAGKESQLLVMIFHTRPTTEELRRRIDILQPSKYSIINAVVEEFIGDSPLHIQLEDLNVVLWGYASLVRAGLPLHGYARQLIKQFTQNTVGGTQATLAETFVRAKVMSSHGQTIDLRDVIDHWVTEGGRKHLAITGEYGQGKSTAMLEFCVDWAKRFLGGFAVNERVPLLIELRGKSPGELPPIDFLAQWGTRYGFQAEKLFALIRSGQAVLIFEGFDELKNAGRQFERHEHFNALWRFAYPGSKILFTGRPNFFIDQSERNSTLRIDENSGAASNAFTEMYAIQMFDEVDVVSACRAYPDEIRVGIKNTFNDHPDFREIVMRPSMLPVVATIWPEIQNAERSGLDITGSMLLERYLSAVYARKEAELENDRASFQTPTLGSYLLLPRAIREALTLAVVWEMAVGDLRNTISRSQFDQVIQRVFDNVLRAMQSSEVRSPTLEEAKLVSARLASENREEFLEKVCTDVASAGLFVPDPVGGPSNLRFAHKQYFEFLIAKFTWVRLAMSDSEVVRALLPAKDSFNSETLWQSEAIGPFERMVGSNLTCFAKSQFAIRFNVAVVYGTDLFAASMNLYLEAARKVLRCVKWRKSPPKLASVEIDDEVAQLAPIRPLAPSFLRIWASGTSVMSSVIGFFAVTASINGKSIQFAFAFISIPLVAIGLLIFFDLINSRKSGPATLFLDLCSIRYGRSWGPRMDISTFLARHRARREQMKFIRVPASTITLQEVVTGVPIPKTLTDKKV